MVDLDGGPTSRALLALEHIQARPGITADRLAGRLGVSERAARRYVNVLRDAGIPVESVRGRYGGYRVGRGIRIPPLMFTGTEALALVMAVLDGSHAAADPSEPVGSALGKLLRVLPEPIAATAEAVRRTTAAAPDRGAVRPDPVLTATLVQACAEERLARVTYRSEPGNEWTLDVEPWAIVVRHGRWYLLCRSVRHDAVRTYRIDRVVAASALDGTFRRSPDLDPVAALEENLGAGWEFTAEVIIDAPLDFLVARLPRTLGRFEALGPGRTRIVGSTSDPEWYVQQLTTIRGPFRVLGGAEVRAAVQTVAARLAGSCEPDLGSEGDRG